MTTRSAREILPNLLEEHGITLNHLATSLAIPQSSLARFLDGSRPLDADRLRLVSRYFRLPPDYFPEVRESAVIDAIRSRPRLRDEIYYERVRRPTRPPST